MYKLYKHKSDKKSNRFFILAKPREGNLADRFPGRYLDGIVIGTNGGEDSKSIGYHTKAWGAKSFTLSDESIMIKSKHIYKIADTLYLRVRNISGKTYRGRGIYEITDDCINFLKYRSDDPDNHMYGVCEERLSNRWTPITECVIKNNTNS